MPMTGRRGEGNAVITSSNARNLKKILSSAITTHESAEIAFLHLIDKYDLT